MSIIKHSIQTQVTARFFQLGEINELTENVIIACHGYAQLAEYFLKWFENTNLTNTVIIAPEGLHRFYWKGFNGRVVASWMTKEDRLDDIHGYVTFLNNVVESLSLKEDVKIHAFGFSQGAATISRWAYASQLNFESIIFWAGIIPEDVKIPAIGSKTKRPIEILFGDQDEFYSLDHLTELKDQLEGQGNKINFTFFQGNHKVLTSPLIQLFQRLNIN